LDHVELIRNGAKSYLVVCIAVDKEAIPELRILSEIGSSLLENSCHATTTGGLNSFRQCHSVKLCRALEAEIRRLVDWAMRDFKEDAQAFGIPFKE